MRDDYYRPLNEFPVRCVSDTSLAQSTDPEIVIERSKPRYPSIRLSILLMMLGACVFLWGFGYKLSLYNLQQPTVHRVPEAKLLSKNEDSQAVEGVHQVIAKAQSGDSLQLIQPALIAVAGACTDCRSFDREESRTSKAATAIPLSGLFFRPPPIHFVL